VGTNVTASRQLGQIDGMGKDGQTKTGGEIDPIKKTLGEWENRKAKKRVWE